MAANPKRRASRKKEFAKPVPFRGQTLNTPKKIPPPFLLGMLRRIMLSSPSIRNFKPRPPSPRIDEVLSICPGRNHAYVMTSAGRFRKPLNLIPSKLLTKHRGSHEQSAD
jgi:hypothetical protein